MSDDDKVYVQISLREQAKSKVNSLNLLKTVKYTPKNNKYNVALGCFSVNIKLVERIISYSFQRRHYVMRIFFFSGCRSPHFGQNCFEICYCEGNATCDPVTGKCPGLCQPGYFQENCSMSKYYVSTLHIYLTFRICTFSVLQLLPSFFLG